MGYPKCLEDNNDAVDEKMYEKSHKKELNFYSTQPKANTKSDITKIIIPLPTTLKIKQQNKFIKIIKQLLSDFKQGIIYDAAKRLTIRQHITYCWNINKSFVANTIFALEKELNCKTEDALIIVTQKI